MIQEKLLEIGFSPNEARVYLELLKIGPQGASVLSKRVNLNRTTLYSLLKKLESRSVVSTFRKNKTKFFAANDPNCLINYVDQKCRAYKYQKKQILNLIPDFREIILQTDILTPIVNYYQGAKAVNQILQEVGGYSGEVYYCAITQDGKMCIRKEFPTDFEFLSIILVYDDRYSILHLEAGNEYGVVVESKEIALMQKNIFNIALIGFNISIDGIHRKTNEVG